jgi:hypothetical protein
MRNINNNLPQYPVSPNSGGGIALPMSQYMVINMEKCIPNSQGQQQTVPVAGVFATLDGRRPNNNDIGTRIIYQYDPLQVVHIITGVQSINPSVGAVPTPWVTTNNPCGGGATAPKSIIAVQCPLGPGLPYPHTFLARINGQSPNQSHIGQTIISPFPGLIGFGANAKFKVTAVTNAVPTPGAPVYQFNTTNTPCGNPTSPRYISVKECPILPNAPIVNMYGVIDNQTPNPSHIGQKIASYIGGVARVYKVMGLPVVPTTANVLPISFTTNTNMPCLMIAHPTIVGCMDPQAINFDPNANAQCLNPCCQYAPRPNPNTPRPMDMMQDSDTSEAMSDIRKGRGLSDERMKRYKELKG